MSTDGIDGLVQTLLSCDDADLASVLAGRWGQGAAGTASALIDLRRRLSASLLTPVLRKALCGAEPLAVVRALSEFVEWAGTARVTLTPLLLERLRLLADHGPHLRRLLRRHPDWLLDDLVDVPLEEQATDIAEADDPESALREFKARHSLSIFAREIDGIPIRETTREFSELAAVCIGVGLQVVRRRLEASDGVVRDSTGEPIGFCVLALGKLGGRELNYSSDVDLIFVYATDDGEVHPPESAASLKRARPLTPHEYFVRLGRELMSFLQQVTPDGYVFRVDMRLRPGGARGPLAHSVDALVDFYEAWGATWQRSAWLKARPVAGDRGVGRAVLSQMEPFVYRRFLDFSALEAIADMKRRVSSHARREQLRWPGRERDLRWDIKVGDGGLREIEFAVQALQLVYAGERPELRTGNTLAGIDRLMVSGILAHHDGEDIRTAYVFFRRLEHRVQMEQDRQTYVIGLDEETLSRFGTRLAMTGEQLSAQLRCHREAVSRVFSRVMPMEEEKRDVELDLARIIELGETEPTAEDLERLSDFGFRNPGRAAEQLGTLMSRPYLPFHGGAPRRLRTLLLEEVLGSPDPDQALVNLTRLVTRVGTRTGYLDLLLSNEQLTHLVVTLFGTSDFLSKRIASFPELIEKLSAPGWLSQARDRAALEHELRDRLQPIDPSDRDRRLNQLRRFKYENILRIGLRDVGELADVAQVRRELSCLAEVLLDASLTEAQLELEGRFGVPTRSGSDQRAPMAVMALGKLGGNELSYASDLDLVFVYDGEGQTEGSERSLPLQAFFGRLAQTLITFMSAHLREGRLYTIDARLRPSGRQGALVTSLEGYRRYSLAEAQLWERQALLRGRFVAGDPPLGKRVEAVMRRSAFGEAEGAPSSSEIAAAVVVSRKRLGTLARSPRERAALDSNRFRQRRLPARNPDYRHVKYGRGGLIDVEFTVQFLQLCHGADEPRLRTASTLDGIAALVESGILARRLGHILDSGYRFLMRLEDRLRIVHDQSIDGWYATADAAQRLALRMGYTGAQAGSELIARFEEETGAVQAVFDEVVRGAAETDSEGGAGSSATDTE